jgi:hypothetical protein
MVTKNPSTLRNILTTMGCEENNGVRDSFTVTYEDGGCSVFVVGSSIYHRVVDISNTAFDKVMVVHELSALSDTMNVVASVLKYLSENIHMIKMGE